MFSDDSIRLRKVEPADLPFLYAVENDDTQWLCSDTHNPLSQKDLRDYIESSTGDILRDGQLRLIVESLDAATLGVIDLFDLDILGGKAAVGIYVFPSVRRCGVGGRALGLLAEYAFNFLNLKQLYAVVPITNTHSLSLFRKAGFMQTATLKAWVRYTDAAVFQLFASGLCSNITR